MGGTIQLQSAGVCRPARCSRSRCATNRRDSVWWSVIFTPYRSKDHSTARFSSTSAQYRVLGQVVEPYPLVRRLDRQRQDVERLALAAPAHSLHGRGELHVPRVADHLVRPVPVPGVPDELLVPHPGVPATRLGRREHRDHRAQLPRAPLPRAPDTVALLVERPRPAPSGDPQVRDEIAEDLVGGGGVAPVEDEQAVPVQPADAPARVAPGDLGAEGQLRTAVHVGTGGRDLRTYLAQPRADRPGLGVFAVVEAQELLGLGDVDGVVAVPGSDRSVAIAGDPGHARSSRRSWSWGTGTMARGHRVAPDHVAQV